MQRGVFWAIGIFIVLVLVGTVFYHNVEKLRWVDSAYFTVITLTTIGYGDFTPQTDKGKIFTIFFVIVGIGFALYILSVVGRSIVRMAYKRKRNAIFGFEIVSKKKRK